MDVQESQSNWPEMRKTLGKPLVLQRRGQEPNNLQIPWETHTSTPRATRNTTRADFIVCDDSKHYPSRPTCNCFTARFTGSRIQDRSKFTGSRFRFTGSQVWSSDSDSFSVSIRHHLAARWMNSGQGGSRVGSPGKTANFFGGAPTGKKWHS